MVKQSVTTESEQPGSEEPRTEAEAEAAPIANPILVRWLASAAQLRGLAIWGSGLVVPVILSVVTGLVCVLVGSMLGARSPLELGSLLCFGVVVAQLALLLWSKVDRRDAWVSLVVSLAVTSGVSAVGILSGLIATPGPSGVDDVEAVAAPTTDGDDLGVTTTTEMAGDSDQTSTSESPDGNRGAEGPSTSDVEGPTSPTPLTSGGRSSEATDTSTVGPTVPPPPPPTPTPTPASSPTSTPTEPPTVTPATSVGSTGGGEPVEVFRSAGAGVSFALEVAPDRLWAGGDAAVDVRGWGFVDGVSTVHYEEHGSNVLALDRLGDGRLVVAGVGGFRVWSPNGLSPTAVLDHGDEIWAVAALEDGRIATGHKSGIIRIWDPNDLSSSKAEVRAHFPNDGAVRALLVRPGGEVLSTGRNGLWRWRPSEAVADPGGGPAQIPADELTNGVAVGIAELDANRVAVVAGWEVRVVNVNRADVLVRASVDGWLPGALAVVSGTIVVGDSEGRVWTWDGVDGSEPRLLADRGSTINALADLGDGTVAVAAEDGSVVSFAVP